MSKKRIIALVLSILVVILGIYTVNLGNKGPGDIEVVSGELKTVEGAYDEAFDIGVESAILIRKVEMYQYVVDKDKTNVVTTDFSDKHEPSQDTDEGYLTNPDFPDNIKSEVFYGKVQIGEDGLYLSDRILEKFSFDDYVNIKNQPEKIPVGGLEDGPNCLGLEPLDDYTYCTIGGDYFEVGDLRVTWYGIDPAELEGIYTAVGGVKDGVIGDNEHIVDIYDKEISQDEVVEGYKGGNKTMGIVLIVIGLILVAVCILPLFKKKNGTPEPTPTPTPTPREKEDWEKLAEMDNLDDMDDDEAIEALEEMKKDK